MTGRLLTGSLLAAALSVGSSKAAPAVPPGSAELPSLAELAQIWTRITPQLPERQSTASPSAARSDALAALAAGHSAQRCATPLMIALYQNASRLNQPTRLLVERASRLPPAWTGAIHMSPGGEFRIHYWVDPGSADRIDLTDADLNAVPDGVDRLASEMTDLLADFVHKLDWAPASLPAGRSAPAASADGAVDVYLVETGGQTGGLGGFVMPRGGGWPVAGIPLEKTDGAHPAGEQAEGTASAIFLDSGLAAPGASSRPMVAHMIAHMILMRESAGESPWWHEASASWLEDRLERDAAALAASFAAPPARGARGLRDDLLGMSMEAFLWPHYLARSTGSDVTLLRRLWQEMAAVPGNNTFESMDRVFKRALGSSLAQEIRVFNVWNLFLGRADDGRHYPFGASLATPQGDATYDVFPARGTSLAGPVPPLGAAMIRLLGDGSRGGLRVRFAGIEPGDWDVALVVHSASRPDDVRHVTMDLDASGRGFIPVPWKSLAEIDVLIQNLAAPTASPADYYFSIEHDPMVPFDLLGLTAAASDPGASLSWTTDSEEHVAGWNVYRGPGPLGPFSRLNRYLIPAAGRPDQPMSYVYVDSSARPGGKYYYYVEGVTFEGFTESSHPAGVRLGATRARRP